MIEDKTQIAGDKKSEIANINFRACTDEDANAVIALIKEAYGNGYVKRELYEAENINAYRKSGFISFTVAEGPDKQVIGVVGREKSPLFKNQCELVTQIIKKEYQNHKISEPQLAFQIAEVLRENARFSSLYAHILACHNKAQRIVEHLGFTSCGFVLNIFDAAVFTVGGTASHCKYSQTIAVKPHKLNDAGTLFVPAELIDLISDTYQKLNVRFVICKDRPEPILDVDASSVMTIRADAANKHIEVCVYRVGHDFRRRLWEIKSLYDKNDNLWTINLYLNLKDANAVEAYNLLVENNFFFTGMQPLSDSGEFIVLHNPLAHGFDMSDIAYIESQKPFAAHILSKKGAARK